MISIDRNIQGLKKHLALELDGIYSREEINSFANLLLEYLLQIDMLSLHSNTNTGITEEIMELFTEYVRQLKKHKPIQYILGETEFYNIKLKLTPDVLIPRPETEELVDWVIRNANKNKKLNIIDIGTGSGCIGISLAKNLTNASVCISDISDKALLVALKNAQLNKVNCQFYLFDILDCEQIHIPNPFDVIISNPPYVREKEKINMAKNILDYEPPLSLFVSDDKPLIFYKEIADFGKKYLKETGEIYVEINENLAIETEKVFQLAGFSFIETKKDINGKYRMLYAKN